MFCFLHAKQDKLESGYQSPWRQPVLEDQHQIHPEHAGRYREKSALLQAAQHFQAWLLN
jgi:hypothetical protein